MADATGSQVALRRTRTVREQVIPSNNDHRHPHPWKDYRSKTIAGHSNYDEIYHSMEEMNLKNGHLELSLYGDHKHLCMESSCKFIIVGVQNEADIDGGGAPHF